MRIRKWISASAVIAAGVMCLTNFYYHHVFVTLYHEKYTMQAMIVCHVIDLVIISVSSVFLYFLNKTNWERNAFVIGFSTMPISSFLFRMVLLSTNDPKLNNATYAIPDIVTSTIVSLLLSAMVSALIGMFLCLIFLEMDMEEKANRRLPTIATNAELYNLISELNGIRSVLKRNRFKHIEKLILQYNKTINTYHRLSLQEKESFREEVIEMKSVLESSLKEALNETKNSQKNEMENNLKEFYAK